MGYENIDDDGRLVKCRKRMRCEWCYEWVDVGEMAVVRVYKYDGDFHYGKLHPECYDALARTVSEMPFFDGFDLGENARGQSVLEAEQALKKGD